MTPEHGTPGPRRDSQRVAQRGSLRVVPRGAPPGPRRDGGGTDVVPKVLAGDGRRGALRVGVSMRIAVTAGAPTVGPRALDERSEGVWVGAGFSTPTHFHRVPQKP